MDLEALRDHVGPGPSDEVLQRLLDAALQSIVERYGPEESEVTERLVPMGGLLFLSRRAQSITSISENNELLDYDQYELLGNTKRIRRLNDDGDATHWTGRVEVTYLPYGDDAERDRVTVALVKLDLNSEPGMGGDQVVGWNQQFSSDPDAYRAARNSILTSLRPPTVGVW